jgi:hypothetical protein
MTDWVEIENDRFLARFDRGEAQASFDGDRAILVVADQTYRFGPGTSAWEGLTITFEDDESGEGWIAVGDDVFRFEDDPHDAGWLVLGPEGAPFLRQFAPWEASLAASGVRLRVEVLDAEATWPTVGLVAGALLIAGRIRLR